MSVSLEFCCLFDHIMTQFAANAPNTRWYSIQWIIMISRARPCLCVIREIKTHQVRTELYWWINYSVPNAFLDEKRTWSGWNVLSLSLSLLHIYIIHFINYSSLEKHDESKNSSLTKTCPLKSRCMATLHRMPSTERLLMILMTPHCRFHHYCTKEYANSMAQKFSHAQLEKPLCHFN